VRQAGELAAYIGGFVAAEGAFLNTDRRFAVAVSLGAVDARTCELIADWFGVGRLGRSPRRKPHYDDEVTFRVDRLRDLVDVVVPFMDEHLPPSYKRHQYEAWRGQLLEYWEHRAKRRRACTVDGCDSPQRARGLCRHHYYATYRR
jgi:hypothetical protein